MLTISRPIVAITFVYTILILIFSFISSLLPEKENDGVLGVQIKTHGTIISEPSISDSKTGFDLNESVSGRTFRVMIFSDKEKYEYGDQIDLNGKVMESRVPGNPDEMDYGRYHKRKGISNSIGVFPDKDGFPKVTAKNKGDRFIALSLALKNRIIALHKNAIPEPYSSLFGSIIFGMKGSPIPDDIKSNYQKSGVVHILVASGQQVSILIGVCLLAFSALGMPSALILIITSFITWSFAAMTGFGSSILRAAVMGQIMIAGKTFDREGDFLNSLCLSALVLLVMDPYNLFDIGFQLTFSATWALVYAAPLINETLQKYVPKYATLPISIAIAPVLATSPISAYNFSQLTPVAFLSNIIVVPMAEMLTVLGFISTAAGLLLPLLSYFLDGFIFAMIYILDSSITFFSHLPCAYTYIEKPDFIWIVLYYVFLVYLTIKAKKGELIDSFKRWKYRILLFLAIFLFFNTLSSFCLSTGDLLINFIDVGQGDSILIETPDNRKILIDAGGKPYTGGSPDKIGSQIVVPFLHRKGINCLDLVVLTHPHDDHAGGMGPVLQEIKVKEVLDTALPYESYAYKNFLRLINRNRIKYNIAKAGQVIDLGDVKASILGPPEQFIEGTLSDPNNNSIVIRLVYGNTSFLLTGDLAFEGEKEIIDSGYPIKSDVLKIGHHGSATSTSDEFLDAVSPKIAVISVGKDNKFGHPSGITLDKLSERGIKTYRTDEDGAVFVRSDGRRIEVSRTN